MVVPYRKAYRIRQENENRFAWLQGMYIYEALCDVSPILHAFAKPGATAKPYPDKPYEFQAEKKQTKEETNKEKMRQTADYLNNLAARFHQSFANKNRDNPPGKE